MSFVSLGDNASTRPTFFEISAADSLMPSLKAATIYSLSVSFCPICRSRILLQSYRRPGQTEGRTLLPFSLFDLGQIQLTSHSASLRELLTGTA